ncbi:hypothetical protein ACJX0J_040540, partial [Zea mays]
MCHITHDSHFNAMNSALPVELHHLIIKAIMWLDQNRAIQQFSQYKGIDNNEQIHTAFFEQAILIKAIGSFINVKHVIARKAMHHHLN